MTAVNSRRAMVKVPAANTPPTRACLKGTWQLGTIT